LLHCESLEAAKLKKGSSRSLAEFDVYFADGKMLRFLCHIEAADLPAAERLVSERVLAEHRNQLLVKAHRT
jgi:hypothetical protein